MRRILGILLLSATSLASAQGFDIWLFDRTDDYAVVGRVTNREGYDNQPAFTLDGRALLFSSDRAGGQTDLFRYAIADGELSNLTETPEENEFSPQPWGDDAFMYVLQEGVPYQHLWIQSFAGGERQRALTSYVPVGYYARNQTGILFWGRYAYSLFFEPAGADIGPGAGESLHRVSQAGRSIHAIPGSTDFSFVHKQDNWSWVIKRLDPVARTTAALVPIDSANEDYCWTPDGTILTASGRSLLRYRPGDEAGWQAEAELEADGLGRGGRCAVSRDGRYLALVGTRAP